MQSLNSRHESPLAESVRASLADPTMGFSSLEEEVPEPMRSSGHRYAGGELAGSVSRSWSNGSMAVDDVRCDGRLEVEFSPRSPTILIIIDEVGGRLNVLGDLRGDNSNGGSVRDAVNVLPGGFTAYGAGDSLKFFRSLTVGFDADQFERVAAETGNAGSSLTPKLMVSDRRIWELCKLLGDECRADDFVGMFYAESLLNALMVSFARLAVTHQRPMAKGGLASWQLRRAEAYMTDNIAKAMSLTEVAELVDFSPSHFCRAFKKSTGKSPYKWMIEARVNMAMTSLLKGDKSLSEISLFLGFCDQSHFTRTFTKVAGVSPMAWQRSHNA